MIERSPINSKDAMLFESSLNVALQTLETDLANGLNTGEVTKRLARWGYNEVV